MTDNIKLPPVPEPDHYAFLDGGQGIWIEGGPTGTPFYSEKQAQDLMREAVRLNAQAVPAAPQPAQHPDDEAVDRFAEAMKQKLAQAREKGRGGWETCPPEELSRMLREHVEKGDPRDVANFCMFLWSLGHGITAPQPAQQPLTDEQEKAGRWEWIEANCLSVIDLAGNRICASATEIDLVRRKP